MARVRVQGVWMTSGAATNVQETNVDVAYDVAELRAGRVTRQTLLAYCLEGVEDTRRAADWEDYVSAVCLAADVHDHAVASEGDAYGYTRSVGTARTGQEPRAAGGITVTQHCACGATRQVNRNRGYEEHGEWTPPRAAQS